MMTVQHIWRYGGIDVIYDSAVDGGGMRYAPPLVSFIKNRFGADRRFGTVFEWCSGAGFIGFALLAEGLCDSLCLADINPAAIDCVNRTIDANQLQNKVRGYVSDNLMSVPKSECFDLVVGNPPSFCAINSAHPWYEAFKGDIRGNDPDWRIHAGFYDQIAPFLRPDAYILNLEVELYKREVFMFNLLNVPLDVRAAEPQFVFAEMIRRGGLTHIENAPFDSGWQVGLNFWLQISRKSA